MHDDAVKLIEPVDSRVPDSLPPTNLDYGRLIRLTGPANAALARYDGLLQSVVNPRVMLSPLTNQEAVLSSKIDGTLLRGPASLETRRYPSYGSFEKSEFSAVFEKRADDGLRFWPFPSC